MDINDRKILRELAKSVLEISSLPVMNERKEKWYKHNDLKLREPMVLCFPETSWNEILPHNELKCSDPLARGWEWNLRSKIKWYEIINDDNVLEPYFDIGWDCEISDYGLEIKASTGGPNGSMHWDPPIKNLEKDIEKLRFRQVKSYKDGTYKKVELANEVFGDILNVRIRNMFWWSLGMTADVIKLLGLEEFMMVMYDEPENLHRLMQFMRDEHLNFIDTLEKSGILTQNNESDSVGSGGVGYTNDIPTVSDVKLKNLWGFCESQETVGISPSMFEEFVFQYQLPIMEKFALNCYGCCEALHNRWEYIKKIPNLRRVSVSPWCDQQKMFDYMGKDYIFSRKPNPSNVCSSFDEDIIRKDISDTLQIAGKGNLEIILKDTQTIQNQPQRLTRWVEIAREEISKYMS